MKRFLSLCLLMLTLSACAAAPSTPTAAPISDSTDTPIPATATAAPTVPPGLSIDQVKNMSIWLPTYQETVQLNQGSFQRDGGEDSLYGNLLEPFATGDLNGDGVDDLAVLVAENGGGSGTFVSLITFFNQDGQPVQQPGVLIDDRPLINDLSIQDQKIIVKATIHSANDPACCPAWDVTETYAVDSSSALALWSLKSMTADNRERSIQIDTPHDGDTVSSELHLSGSMPIAPFENALTYIFYDENGNILLQGAFNVIAEDPGGPGTFDQILNPPAAPSGSRVRLTLAEENMADGTTYLSCNSVDLYAK